MTTVAIPMHNKFRADVKDFCFEANEAQHLIKFRPLTIQGESRRLFSSKTIRAEGIFKDVFSLKAAHRLAKEDILILLCNANLQDDEDDEYFFVSNRYYESTLTEYPGTGVLSLHYLKKTSTFTKEAKADWNTMTESRKTDLLRLLIFGLITNLLIKLNCHQDSQRGCTMDYCQEPRNILRLIELGFPFCELCTSVLNKSDEGVAVLAIANHLRERRHREFADISDRSLRAILATDYEELHAAFRAKCWKSVIVLAGAVMEGLLVDRLKRNHTIAVSAKKAPRDNKANPEKWQLTDLINVAIELKLIGSNVEKYPVSLRDFRNLIHPVRQAQIGLQLNKSEAQLAMTLLDMVRKGCGTSVDVDVAVKTESGSIVDRC